MPKVVDHDARRQILAATAANVIAQRGLENTTLKDVAAEAGFTPGLVGHYFDSKDQLMRAALSHVDQRSAERFALLRNRSLRRALEAILPLDHSRREEWWVRISFWGRTMVQPKLKNELAQSMVYAQDTLEYIINEQKEQGHLRPDLDATVAAEAMLNLLMGMSLRILFDPKLYTRKKVMQTLDDYVNDLAREPSADEDKSSADEDNSSAEPGSAPL
ncbi:TetR/AcrR family transcriptional regulator [Ferrimonas pelagia]|uniref:HTH tetR-type domain-containing protein n=1 Tax=Ferrimonas pelagia TaxID=1177826 RepID=A0ABP9EIA7_9GAMM